MKPSYRVTGVILMMRWREPVAMAWPRLTSLDFTLAHARKRQKPAPPPLRSLDGVPGEQVILGSPHGRIIAVDRGLPRWHQTRRATEKPRLVFDTHNSVP